MSEIYEKSTEIIFVRHGQTDFNKQRLYFGHLDPKLNETGISQLKNTKKLLHKLEKNISKVYSSDLKRCVESMKLLEIDAEVEKILTEDLREMNFGVLEGKTFEEAKEEFPGFVENLKNNWKKLRFDGSESVEDLYFRVSDKLSKIAEENKDYFISNGGESYQYIPALNASPAHIETLGRLVINQMAKMKCNNCSSPNIAIIPTITVPTSNNLSSRCH